MKNVIIILTSLILFSCNSKKELQPPRWIYSFNNSDVYIESVGVAKSKNESLLNALINISREIQTQIESDGNGINLISESAFGKVKIQSLTKRFVEETGIDDSIKIIESFSIYGKLTFSNGNKKLLYTSSLEKEATGKDSTIQHQFSVSEQNCTLKDIIDELNSVGYEFKFYYDHKDYYTLVGCEKKIILENINKQ